MKTEPLADWAARIKNESGLWQDFYKMKSNDDSSGWGDCALRIFKKPYDQRPSGYVLIGPVGSGKHQTAGFLLREMLQDEAFSCIFLDGAALSEENDGKYLYEERINKLLDDSYDEEKSGLCLVIEQVTECSHYQELMSFLGRTILENRLTSGEEHPLYVLLFATEELSIPSNCRSLFRTCKLGLPNQTSRRKYIVNNSLANWPDVENYKLTDMVTAQTEGFSYVQLEDMLSALQMKILQADDENEYIGTDAAWVEEFIKEYAPPMPEEDWHKSLALEISEFLKKLPELIERLPAGGVIQTVPVQIAENESKADQAVEQESQSQEEMLLKVSEEPGHQLVSEIFTEEQIASVLHN